MVQMGGYVQRYGKLEAGEGLCSISDILMTFAEAMLLGLICSPLVMLI